MFFLRMRQAKPKRKPNGHPTLDRKLDIKGIDRNRGKARLLLTETVGRVIAHTSPSTPRTGCTSCDAFLSDVPHRSGTKCWPSHANH